MWTQVWAYSDKFSDLYKKNYMSFSQALSCKSRRNFGRCVSNWLKFHIFLVQWIDQQMSTWWFWKIMYLGFLNPWSWGGSLEGRIYFIFSFIEVCRNLMMFTECACHVCVVCLQLDARYELLNASATWGWNPRASRLRHAFNSRPTSPRRDHPWQRAIAHDAFKACWTPDGLT